MQPLLFLKKRIAEMEKGYQRAAPTETVTVLMSLDYLNEQCSLVGK